MNLTPQERNKSAMWLPRSDDPKDVEIRNFVAGVFEADQINMESRRATNRCQCAGAVYGDHAKAAFDPDPYDCANCGHMNGDHHGPNGECTARATDIKGDLS